MTKRGRAANCPGHYAAGGKSGRVTRLRMRES